MATKNRTELKVYFETNKRPNQTEFENLIDSNLNILEDKASNADAQNDQVDDKFLTPKTAKQSVIAFAPVKKVNNIAPDSNGNVSIVNISGTAGSITGSIAKNQVTGLETDLNSKQAVLVSGTNIKTINGQSVLGNGDVQISGAPPKLIGVLSSNFSLGNIITAQNAFPAACNEFTLSANKTYFFKGLFLIANGATSHTTAIGWLASNGLSITSMEYVAKLYSAPANGISTSVSFVQVSGIGSKVLNAANEAVTTTIEFEGVLRCTNGVVLSPLLTFSAAPGVSNQMKSGSFIEFTELGTNLIQTVGTVS